MKARYKHHQDETVYNLSTRELIGLGVREGHGRIECLEDRINHLIFVLASLIDRSGLSDDEVLEITGADLRVEIAKENE